MAELKANQMRTASNDTMCMRALSADARTAMQLTLTIGLRTSQLFVMAYPSFNVNEIIAIADLYEGSARDTGRPIIIFNGELDRIRSGYYPRLVYRKLAKLADDFIPLFESTFYIHNFKGVRSGALFRVYPGPWQVSEACRKPSTACAHVCCNGLATYRTMDLASVTAMPAACRS